MREMNKKGLNLLKGIAVRSAEKTMKSACFGFNYQPVSHRKKNN